MVLVIIRAGLIVSRPRRPRVVRCLLCHVPGILNCVLHFVQGNSEFMGARVGCARINNVLPIRPALVLAHAAFYSFVFPWEELHSENVLTKENNH